MDNYSVVIIERSMLIRDGLRHILLSPPFSVVATGKTFKDALHDLGKQIQPTLVLFSSSTEDEITAQIAEIQEWPETLLPAKRVMVTDVMDPDILRSALAGDTDALLSRDISDAVLRRSLELVLLGQKLYPAFLLELPASSAATSSAVASAPAPRVAAVEPPAKEPVEPKPASSRENWNPLQYPESGPQDPPNGIILSEREAQILRHIVRGFSNKSVARELKITEATVKVHVKGLLRKIRATNRTQAAIWAIQNRNYINDPSGKVVDLAVASMAKKVSG
jgi:two-component system, NarL family, nitrate/nitrite response regulator NarL